MIHIYRGDSEIGVALYDLDTNKFVYGEMCSKERLITFVTSFPDHPVTIFIENAWKDEVQEIYFLLPHLQDLAKVKVQKRVDVKLMLSKAAKVKVKRNLSLVYLVIGIMVGCMLLIPTSLEYKASVLTQAKTLEGFTEDFVKTQPNTESLQDLYTSINKLYSEVRVEAVTYSVGSFKVIFSSANQDLTVADLEGFEKATLTKVSSLENGEDSSVHIYELEGNL